MSDELLARRRRRPLLVICQHCYQPAVGSFTAVDDEVWVCDQHRPAGAELVGLPTIDYSPRRGSVVVAAADTA